MPRVYGPLRAIAGRRLRGERDDHTLQSAALVHEAYVRLIELERVQWRNRVHFYAICAQMMRRILVDHARHGSRVKRGGRARKVILDELQHAAVVPQAEIVDLDHALRELAAFDRQQARIVELRFFGGLDRDEIAAVLGISSATVSRRWRMARAWLYRKLVGGEAVEL